MASLRPLLLCIFIPVTLGQPLLKIIGINSSFFCNPNFLVADKDYSVVEAELSSIDPPKSPNTPAIYHTREGAYDAMVGYAFNPNGSCYDHWDLEHSVYCKKHGPGVWRLFANITSTLSASKQLVQVIWDMSDGNNLQVKSDLPEVRETCPAFKFIQIESSHTCSRDFLVAGEDHTKIVFSVTGTGSIKLVEPLVTFTVAAGHGLRHKACNVFDHQKEICTDGSGAPDTCSCEKSSAGVYTFNYTIRAEVNISRGNVYLQWPGDPDLRSEDYTLPKIVAKCPTVKLVKLESAFSCSRHALVSGEDSTLVQFEVTGADVFENHEEWPVFFYADTESGNTSKTCNVSFNPDTKKCESHKDSLAPDTCSCENSKPDVYLFSYTIKADMNFGNASVYFHWPGLADLRSDIYTLPDVWGQCCSNGKKLFKSDDNSSVEVINVTAVIIASISAVTFCYVYVKTASAMALKRR